MGKTRQREHYATSEEIYEEWKRWKETGVVSEKMGGMMLRVA